MTEVSNVRSTSPASPLASSAAARPPAPPVLPPNGAPSAGALSDALSQLYMVLNQQRDMQANLSKGQSQVAEAERTTAMQKQEHAMKRAQEAAAKGGLFDWVSKDIGLAGAVGLVTFNYGLVAADVAAHKLGVFEHVEEEVDLVDVAAVATGRWDVLAAEVLLRKTDLAPEEARELLARCGVRADVPGITDEDVKPVAKDLLMANLMVLAVGATVLSCGSTTSLVVALAGFALSQAGGYVAREGTFGECSEYVGLGMQLGGAAAMGCATFASSDALIHGGKAAAGIANGTISTAQGTDRIVVAVHEQQRDAANTQVAVARHRLAQVQRMAETVIDHARDANDSHRKAAETIQGVVQNINATHVAMAQGVRA